MPSLSITTLHLKMLELLNCAGISSSFNSNIVHSYKHPQRLCDALSTLSEERILTNETFQLVTREHDPNQIAEALGWLEEANLLKSDNMSVLMRNENLLSVADILYWLHMTYNLAQKTFDVVVKHFYPELLERALCSLNKANILTDKNFDVLAAHTNIVAVTVVIDYLDKTELFSQTTFNTLIKHADPDRLGSALSILYQCDMVTKENYYLVAGHAHPKGLAKALCTLDEEDLFTIENIKALLGVHPLDVAKLLIRLSDINLLNPDNRNLVASHPYPLFLRKALSLLDRANLGTQENFELVARHSYPASVVEALSWLTNIGVFTQRHFTELFDPAHQALFIISKRMRICAQLDASDLCYWENILLAARKAIPSRVVTAKLRALIQKEVLKYLTTFASPSTTKEAAEFNGLMRRLDQGNMIILWPHIKKAVGDGFYKEFVSLFESKQDSHFIEYIDIAQSILGKYARFGTVSTLQKQFSESDGYRQSMYQMFRSSATFFSATDDVIERRHDNPYMQELYDRQFGLVLR